MCYIRVKSWLVGGRIFFLIRMSSLCKAIGDACPWPVVNPPKGIAQSP